MQGAVIFAERIRHAVEEYDINQKRYPNCKISMSIGLVEFSGPTDSSKMLFNRVDKALYHSKEKGRNRITIFEEGKLRPYFKPAPKDLPYMSRV